MQRLITSEPGLGATFTVWVPAWKHAAPPQAIESKKGVGEAGRGETLLIVEDEAALRRVLRSVLDQRGYRVLEAANGVDALRIWALQSSEIELVITDLVMPGGVNGQELIRQFRVERPTLKVIFMSGYSRGNAGKEMELDDGAAFLQKPAEAAVLLEAGGRQWGRI